MVDWFWKWWSGDSEQPPSKKRKHNHAEQTQTKRRKRSVPFDLIGKDWPETVRQYLRLQEGDEQLDPVSIATICAMDKHSREAMLEEIKLQLKHTIESSPEGVNRAQLLREVLSSDGRAMVLLLNHLLADLYLDEEIIADAKFESFCFSPASNESVDTT